MELKALSLFSGIGGLDLAAEMAGIETVAFCDIEPFPVEVLKKRFPDVPIFSDVRKLKRGDIDGTIDIIHGGFPCQDRSVAGVQKGLEDEEGKPTARSGLWFEMLRVIHEIRPRYVVAENVRGAVNLALDTVQAGMEDEGYKVWAFVLPAAAFGAPHQRERLFVVGVREDVHRQYTEAIENPGCELRQGSEFSRADGVETGNRDADKFERPSGTLWPTPQAVDGSAGGIISPDDIYVQKASGLFRKINRNGIDGSVGLARMVKLWPTPRGNKVIVTNEQAISRINKTGYHGNLEEAIALQKMLGNNPEVRKDRGQLNPDWVEQLMNFPEGWTDLEVDEPSKWVGWPALLG